MSGCCEPKFWRGDKLCWPDGKGRYVTVLGGPYSIMGLRENVPEWGDVPVYLCELSDGTSILIGEPKLRSPWLPCPGEHREARDGGWEKLT